MSINDTKETPSIESPGRSDNRFLGFLHVIALIGVITGAVGSVGLTLYAGRNTPRFLLVLFIIWVLSPFAALAWANLKSKRWSVLTRATLYCVTLVIVLASLAIYGKVVLPPAESPRAFAFIVVPLGSWLLMVIIVPMAEFISRRRPHPSAGV
jgi:membrane protease YdiL (CAAX protease family)